MVFNQEHRTNDPQVLNYTGDLSDPLVRRMVERLARAASDQQVRREMEAEEEVEGIIANIEQEYQADLKAKDAVFQEMSAVIQATEAVLREKDAKHQAEWQEFTRQMAELRLQLAELRKAKE